MILLAPTYLAHVISRPFRANPFLAWFPGLKPWAEWREVKGCLGCFLPRRGCWIQGFNLFNRARPRPRSRYRFS